MENVKFSQNNILMDKWRWTTWNKLRIIIHYKISLFIGTPSTSSSSGLSPGATTGIIFAVLVVVGIVIFIVVHDKHKKGQLLPWWRKQKQDFKNCFRGCFQGCIPERRTQTQPAPREITLETNVTSQTTTQVIE